MQRFLIAAKAFLMMGTPWYFHTKENLCGTLSTAIITVMLLTSNFIPGNYVLYS